MAVEKPQPPPEDWPMTPRVAQAFIAEVDYDREVVRRFDTVWFTEPSPAVDSEVIPNVPSTSDYH